jgi:hypothetical protein
MGWGRRANSLGFDGKAGSGRAEPLGGKEAVAFGAEQEIFEK